MLYIFHLSVEKNLIFSPLHGKTLNHINIFWVAFIYSPFFIKFVQYIEELLNYFIRIIQDISYFFVAMVTPTQNRLESQKNNTLFLAKNYINIKLSVWF